jgi:hypothetical protein
MLLDVMLELEDIAVAEDLDVLELIECYKEQFLEGE